MLAGDYSIVPTDIDIYPTTSSDNNALLQPASAAHTHLIKQGWTDCLALLRS